MDDLQITLTVTKGRIRRVLYCPDQSVVLYSLFRVQSLHTQHSCPTRVQAQQPPSIPRLAGDSPSTTEELKVATVLYSKFYVSLL